MKRKMIDFIGLADQKYVDEADPKSTRLKPRFKWTACLASAACFLLILNLAIFLPILLKDDGITPPPTASSLQNTITPGGLNQIQNSPITLPSQPGDEIALVGNDKIVSALDKFFQSDHWDLLGKEEIKDAMDKIEDEFESDSSNEESGSSSSLHDEQVKNVTEGDIAKKSDTHLFYLRDAELYVYDIRYKETSPKCILPIGTYLTKAQEAFNSLVENELLEKEGSDDLSYLNGWELYLSKDFKTLTVILTSRGIEMTGMLVFDVSDAPAIEFKTFRVFSGKYITSRVTEKGEMLIFTNYTVNKSFDKENPLAYMPFLVENGLARLSDNVFFPTELSSNKYVMITRLDQSGSVMESSSYLSYSNNIFVSRDNIVLSRLVDAKNPNKTSGRFVLGEEYLIEDEIYGETTLTELAVINYSSELFKNLGYVTIDGYLKDRYSLDEYNGILRAVTTTNRILKLSNGILRNTSSASLYCIDLEKMEIAASVKNFAPYNEEVRSARFDGSYAYVCTALKYVPSDPVFFFDLSDIQSITYTDTGTIDGYSTSLINIGDGYLVGIGVGESTDTLKVEVYKEEGEAVVSVAVFELPKTRYSTNYKSYLVDRERHIIGFAISTRQTTETSQAYFDKYLILRFDTKYEYFSHIETVSVGHIYMGAVRAFEKNNTLYVVTDCGFYAKTLSSIGIFDKYFVSPN